MFRVPLIQYFSCWKLLVFCGTASFVSGFGSPSLIGRDAFFPIGVWLQSPENAQRYRDAGINTYVGLWQGPTATQLTQLQNVGMRVVCAQNETALTHPSRSNIIAWAQPDEPDNVQVWGARLGFGKPTSPTLIAENYRQLKSRDPTRPIFLNLGQGFVWNNWYGRGNQNGLSEDYPRYLESCDIASFDIYPANHPDAEVRGNLWFVADGVLRLRQMTDHRKPVWTFIECAAIHHQSHKPTAIEVRAQVWMALIHGARGIVYFAHQFEPTFVEAALLNDADLLNVVTSINREIGELAPILKQDITTNRVAVRFEPASVPIAFSAHETENSLYVFAVAMRPGKASATFTLIDPRHELSDRVEVLGESREVKISAAAFSDDFAPWQVHLYRISKRSAL